MQVSESLLHLFSDEPSREGPARTKRPAQPADPSITGAGSGALGEDRIRPQKRRKVLKLNVALNALELDSTNSDAPESDFRPRSSVSVPTEVSPQAHTSPRNEAQALQAPRRYDPLNPRVNILALASGVKIAKFRFRESECADADIKVARKALSRTQNLGVAMERTRLPGRFIIEAATLQPAIKFRTDRYPQSIQAAIIREKLAGKTERAIATKYYPISLSTITAWWRMYREAIGGTSSPGTFLRPIESATSDESVRSMDSERSASDGTASKSPSPEPRVHSNSPKAPSPSKESGPQFTTAELEALLDDEELSDRGRLENLLSDVGPWRELQSTSEQPTDLPLPDLLPGEHYHAGVVVTSAWGFPTTFTPFFRKRD